MATRAQKTKVGIFIIACGILIAAGVLIMIGYNHEERLPYWIEFDESVLGLVIGGTVEYSGVPVGIVKNIRVTDKNNAHVDIMITSSVGLREGVTARLVLYSMATGTMCVSLEGGDGPLLAPGSQIVYKPSMLKDYSSQIETLLSKLSGISDTVNNGLVGMQEGDLALMVDDASGLLLRGQQFLDSLNETLAELRGKTEGTLDDFRDLSKDVRKLVKNTNDAVTKVTKKVEMLKVAETGDNVNEALKNISALTKRLQESAAGLDTVSKRAVHEVDNVEFNMRETLRTLNESLEAVRDLATYLQRDPSSLIRGKGKPKGDQ